MSIIERTATTRARKIEFVSVLIASLVGTTVLVVWTFWLIEHRESAALLAFSTFFLTMAAVLLGNTYSLKEYRAQLGRQIRFGEIAERYKSEMPTRGFLHGRLKVLKAAVSLGVIAVVGAVIITSRTDEDAWVVGIVAVLLSVLVGGIATFSQPVGTVQLESLRIGRGDSDG